MPSDLAHAANVIAAIMFCVIGVSHMLRPQAWTEFFTDLHGRGRPGVFINSFFALFFGMVIVGLHNLWTWPAIILTVIGWSQVLKGLVGFIVPSVSARGFALIGPGREWRVVTGGLFSLILGLWFAFRALET
jgi:hypothetical protein